MDQSSRELLYELLRTPAPTGCEQLLQRKIYHRFQGVAHTMEPDVHGNLILGLNPHARRKVMLAGHSDQIGFLVKYISPDGFL
jgi:putative aminopeptidase FrvX